MKISECLSELESYTHYPEMGVGDEIFHYISSITPIVNVDLLIYQEHRGILLAWREDEFQSSWHIPGGILRFKETFDTRIQRTACCEIGTQIKYNAEPKAINQIILEQRIRGHFISFLFQCYLPDDYMICETDLEPKPGELRWFAECPKNFHTVQRKIYSNLWYDDSLRR